MIDLEITKLCAEAMGLEVYKRGVTCSDFGWKASEIQYAYFLDEGQVHNPYYAPLSNDAQAMALVKKFNLELYHNRKDWQVRCKITSFFGDKDLNRAICECVAKMQKEKGK